MSIFVAMGALYGSKLIDDKAAFESVFTKTLQNKGEIDLEADKFQESMLMNLIYQMAPILNDSCKLDCLTNESGENKYGGSAAFKSVMGLCFNNDIYFQMSKGLLPVDVLEIVANCTSLSP